MKKLLGIVLLIGPITLFLVIIGIGWRVQIEALGITSIILGCHYVGIKLLT